MKQRVYLLKRVVVYAGICISLAVTYETAAGAYVGAASGSPMQGFRNHLFPALFILVSHISRTHLYAPLVCLLALYALVRERLLTAVFLFISLHGARYLNLAVQAWFERTRPDISTLMTATGYSFPSGHTKNAIAFIGCIAYLAITENRLELGQKTVIIVLGSLLLFSMAMRHVCMGVRESSNIVAGCAAGGAWLVLCILFHKFFQPTQPKETASFSK